MKILFQGDSITHAFRRSEEENPAFQLGNGYVFLIAARLSRDLPGNNLSFVNRGVCGEDVPDLQARWRGDALDFQPDLLSLLVGVNGTGAEVSGKSPVSPRVFSEIYRQLLDGVKATNPSVQLVLLEPFLLATGEGTADRFERLRPRQAAVREIAADYDAIFIPLQTLFDAALADAPAKDWAWDGIHPTHYGFQLIADAWLEATKALPFRKPTPLASLS